MYKSYQLSIITDDGIITTRHYGLNGEIAEVLEDLWERSNAVENRADLNKEIAAFINDNQIPPDDIKPESANAIFTQPLPKGDEIQFNIENEWYADFVVIRNITDRDFNIDGLQGKASAICLYGGEGVILNLGCFYAGSDDDLARRKFLAELDDLKENLWDSNAGKNYSLIWNLCSDYDNDQNDDLYLTDIIQEAEFMDEELLQDYFENVLAKDPSLARLRHFIGDTYDDDIYRFDGYGNLANVEKDDFIEVIDIIEDRVIDAIQPCRPFRPQSAANKNPDRADDACM